jgi:DNA-binding MarR family transcriptional regulator
MKNDLAHKFNDILHILKTNIFNRQSSLDSYIIDKVNRYPNMPVKELLTKLNVPQSTLSSAISRLCDKGLLKRSISDEDSRSFYLQLTEEGRKIQDEHDFSDLAMAEKALSALDSDEERAQLIYLLEKITHKII